MPSIYIYIGHHIFRKVFSDTRSHGTSSLQGLFEPWAFHTTQVYPCSFHRIFSLFKPNESFSGSQQKLSQARYRLFHATTFFRESSKFLMGLQQLHVFAIGKSSKQHWDQVSGLWIFCKGFSINTKPFCFQHLHRTIHPFNSSHKQIYNQNP